MNTSDKVKSSYKNWSLIYDTNENKTRDLDYKVSQEILKNIPFDSVLEIGCGTGKNTKWLSKKASKLVAVDLSSEMLQIAKQKVNQKHVQFIEADITKAWSFNQEKVAIICFNLVLEHVENLDFVFKNASFTLNNSGYLYLCELHPFKQYLGSQAKFENTLVPSFTHQISDYINTSKKYGLICEMMMESYDTDKKENEEKIPRLISILFRKVSV
jgi:ubiquinone/menaquinone biosynthesis C-methylase UbiE